MKLSLERIQQLNYGFAETKNLIELSVIDFNILLPRALPNNFLMPVMPQGLGITKRMQAAAAAIDQQYGFGVFKQLATHNSDIIRGVACYLVGLQNLTLQEKLQQITPLANDPNPGVREWAWISLRPSVAHQLQEALILLNSWIGNESPYIRRYASEITRPRGVWCSHIKALRLEPWLAIHLLEPLKSDPERYVQLSVANWLNDASKDHPSWVIELCSTWQQQSPSIATHKICKRALRNQKI